VTTKWKVPLWMKPYLTFVTVPHGLEVEDVMNGSSLMIPTLVENTVKGQVALLMTMHEHGCLPEQPNKYALGTKVIDINGRTGQVREVLWSVGYLLDDQDCTELNQEDEIKLGLVKQH
jgi:hypothetical protein